MSMTRPTTEQITHKGQLLSTVLEQAVNVKDFGAVGDGVTDDLSAIRNAVAAVRARGGGTVFIPRTANGYYVSVNSGCNLSNSSGISIISDGAEIKMQGASNLSGGEGSILFVGTNVSNFTMQGLIFSATSTVLRLNNGDTGFNTAVSTGNGNALAQTSFRYVMNLTGICHNIWVDNCDFMTGVYYALSVKNPPVPGDVKNLRFTNLRAIGLNSMLIFTSGCHGIIVDNIVVDGGQDSNQDHMLYTASDCRDITVSNCQYRNALGTPYTFGLGPINITLNNHVSENTSGGQLFFRGGAENAVCTNLQFINCGNLGQSPIGSNSSCKNIVISNVLFRNCGLAMRIGDLTRNANCSNFTLRNFVVDSCDTAIQLDSGTNLVIENGLIINSHTAGQTVIFTGPSDQSLAPLAASDAVVRNVDIVYTTANPPGTVVSNIGALWNLTYDNVSFRRVGGTTTVIPIVSNGATINVRNCRLDGFTNGLVSTSGLVLPVGEVIDAQPLETTLTANSATPSVASAKLFVTANTSATAYTNFTNGVQGQEICIRVNDANTTFDFTGTSLKGRNGVDYTATSGDVIFAKRIGSNWYCTVVEA